MGVMFFGHLVFLFIVASLNPCQIHCAIGSLVSQIEECDVYNGSWVYDESYPLYDASSCPFISLGFDCLKNGRPDRDYLKYMWKPNGCDLPRFDGKNFLELNRGKKIMFVGDSLSNNMWLSLICLLHTALPDSIYTISQGRPLSTFSIPDYNVSVMLITNGFLVDVVNDNIGKVLKLDSITRGDQWKGVDMLIFNTYHWWFHTGSAKTWDYFQVGNQTVQEMDRLEAFRIALTTWGKWVDTNIDPNTTTVLFQGISASHAEGKACQGKTKPISGSTYPGTPIAGLDILKKILSEMQMQVNLLDLTLLTQLRIDGHPSIYTGAGNKLVDCSHWCLAGVPDTWNQLLYSSLLNI